MEIKHTIDWSRMAKPQNDGYDTKIILEFIQQKIKKNEALSSFESKKKPIVTSFNGTVGIDYVKGHPSNRFIDAPLHHENIDKAVNYVCLWEPVFIQFQKIIHTIHPWIDTFVESDSLGSCSHSKDNLLGVIYATVNNPHGLAQAFVHEMAHNKLRSLGIMLESADKLIMNASDELFDSPIRKDCKRPMTAVFHAQYSFMHVTALDIININKSDGEEDKLKWLCLLQNNIPRMEEGDIEIKKHLKTDEDGADFFKGFFDWSEEVLTEGNLLLKKYEYLKFCRYGE